MCICPYAHMCEMNINDICSCVHAYMQMSVYITLFAYVNVCVYVWKCLCSYMQCYDDACMRIHLHR